MTWLGVVRLRLWFEFRLTTCSCPHGQGIVTKDDMSDGTSSVRFPPPIGAGPIELAVQKHMGRLQQRDCSLRKLSCRNRVLSRFACEVCWPGCRLGLSFARHDSSYTFHFLAGQRRWPTLNAQPQAGCWPNRSGRIHVFLIAVIVALPRLMDRNRAVWLRVGESAWCRLWAPCRPPNVPQMKESFARGMRRREA